MKTDFVNTSLLENTNADYVHYTRLAFTRGDIIECIITEFIANHVLLAARNSAVVHLDRIGRTNKAKLIYETFEDYHARGGQTTCRKTEKASVHNALERALADSMP